MHICENDTCSFVERDEFDAMHSLFPFTRSCRAVDSAERDEFDAMHSFFPVTRSCRAVDSAKQNFDIDAGRKGSQVYSSLQRIRRKGFFLGRNGEAAGQKSGKGGF